MFAGWDNYDIQETRRIAKEGGLEEGRKQEKYQTVIGMKNEGFDDDTIARVTMLPVEEIRGICTVSS